MSFFSRATIALCLSATLLPLAHAADVFTKPTKEELEMKELKGFPGVPAVVLFREQITKDDMHVVQHYERVKILTERGKEYANVELPYISSFGDGFNELGDDKSVGDVVGRTIHADGTIIPFTGKPYKKVIKKSSEYSYTTLVFTLPDVEIGSIIEYRYATRIADHMFEAPDWYIQGPLYVKSAHYAWYPTLHLLEGHDGAYISSIAWYPVLPAGAQISRKEIAAANVNIANSSPQQLYELNIKDVAPEPKEEYMPPISGFSYRVLYYYTEYHSAADFWKDEGKAWSKRINTFADGNSAFRSEVQTITTGATTPEEKLRKIYAAVQALENTHFTRTRARQEDKAAGLGKVNNVGDVLAHKRGAPNDLAVLFIAMARAAGLKAFAMYVPDRSIELYTPAWLSFRQFDDVVAIVNYDGKDHFFDPGERYCPYEHLAWQHTFVTGLRQTDSGTGNDHTPGDPYTLNRTLRVGNLTMDEHGEVAGKIDITFNGANALEWRQRALKGDEESIRHSFRTTLERMLPGAMEVKVSSIDNLTDYEKPLAVHYEVKGPVGAPTGKRLMVPVDIFVSRVSATFPQEKREVPVYFHHPTYVQDAVRIKLPKNIAVEAVPDAAKESLPQRGAYDLSVTSTPDSFTTRRNFTYAEVLVPLPEYADLRTFYSKFESKDKETVVLKAEGAVVGAAAPAASKDDDEDDDSEDSE